MDLPLMLLLKMAVSFLSAFLSIWVWSRIREEGWMFLVLGALLHFFGLLMEVLSLLGILPFSVSGNRTIPLWFVLLQLLPYACYSLAFLFFIYRSRHH